MLMDEKDTLSKFLREDFPQSVFSYPDYVDLRVDFIPALLDWVDGHEMHFVHEQDTGRRR